MKDPTFQTQVKFSGHEDRPLSMTQVKFFWPGTSRAALSDVAFSAGPGEVVGVIGPNGAGKSTLLRLSAGFIRPSSGNVSVFGQNPARLPRRQVARLLAFVPSTLHVGFPLSVADLVGLGRTSHLKGVFETAHDREVVSQAMEFADIARFAGRQYVELSTGEQRRVLIARAVAQESRLLLLDEPTANLDASQAVRMLEGISSMARDTGTCVVAAIHDLNVALLVCDKVLLVRDGVVEAFGKPEDVMLYSTLKTVFDCDFYIDRNELNGKLFVVPMRSQDR